MILAAAIAVCALLLLLAAGLSAVARDASRKALHERYAVLLHAPPSSEPAPRAKR